jgi:hypothetical protein
MPCSPTRATCNDPEEAWSAYLATVALFRI